MALGVDEAVIYDLTEWHQKPPDGWPSVELCGYLTRLAGSAIPMGYAVDRSRRSCSSSKTRSVVSAGWIRMDGYPIPKITRVRLRRPGSNIDTHYVDAPWMADIFGLGLIDGDFVALKQYGPASET